MKHILLASLTVLLVALVVHAAQPAKTYPLDNDGFVKNWLVADPVQLDDSAAKFEEAEQKPIFDREYVKKVDNNPKPGDKLKAGDAQLLWKAEEASEYFVDLGKVADDRTKEKENSLFLGVAYVWSDREIKDVKLAIGSDDSSVWWLNGKEVMRVYEGRGIDKDQNTSKPLTLNKGMNVLRFAVINGLSPTGACARFMDGKKPVKDLKVSVEPGE